MADAGAEREYVAGLYQEHLGRTPDIPGLEYWTNQLVNGTLTREQVDQALQRAEPGRYVQRLYRDILGRDPSREEIDYWAPQLANGTYNRFSLRRTIETSAESLSRPTTPQGAPIPEVDAGPSVSQQNAFDEIREVIRRYGLPETLADWAWQQIIGGRTATQVALDLYDRPEFQQRFPGIAARQQAGLAPISPAEYIAYEQAAGQILRMAGLPQGFYDSTEDFTRFIANDLSVAELSQRVSDEGFGAVANAPQEVRDWFADAFGAQGDAMLAAYFLDPDKATPILKRHAQMAEIGGRVRIGGGLSIGMNRANELAAAGISGSVAQQAAADVRAREGLFTETVTEFEDFTLENEGLDATLGLSGKAQAAVRRRTLNRQAAFSGGGGAAAGQTGVAGLGTER